jgi:hypothetical protein
MADTFVRQVSYTGAKEMIFAHDSFLIESLGYTRVGSNPFPWPSLPSSLPNNCYAVYRSPSAAPVKFEVKLTLDVDTPGSGTGSLLLRISPLIDPGSGWTDGAGSFGTNPATSDVALLVSVAGAMRVTFLGDDRRFQIWNESTGTYGQIAYVGRFISAYDAGVDPFPVLVGAGGRNLINFTGFKRVSPRDNLTELTGGYIAVPRHPTVADQDPFPQETEASTLDWPQWDCEVHWVQTVVPGSPMAHHPGWLDRMFIMAYSSDTKLWGVNGEYASKHGLLHAWEPRKPILT